MEKKVIFKTTKRELTDEIRNMAIDDVRELRFDVKELKSLGINTFGELLEFDTEKLANFFENKHSFGYERIIDAISDLGFIMNDDKKKYEELNISDEVALVPVKELGLSQRVKVKLMRKLNINYLGKLLITKWRVFNNYRFHLYDEELIEIKNYIHSLGYTIIDEEETLTEVKRSKGTDLIEISLGLSNKVANIMYRNGIFTIDDLLRFGPGIYNVFGMGDVKRNELALALKSKGISFSKSDNIELTVKEGIPTIPNEDIINNLRLENSIIQTRIDKKRALLDEYNLLINEQQKLKIIESELDRLIVDKLNSKECGDKNVRR